MNPPVEITTDRLLLRQWCPGDRDPFAAINADPEVMQFFPSTLDREASDSAVDRWQAQIAERGWGMWAAELTSTGELIGFVGLQMTPDYLPIRPGVEIGWRLARAHWGRGLASEAASAALRFGFEQIGLAEIVSVAPKINLRSRAVMERLGMQHIEPTFPHPKLPAGSPLRECCLYRLTQEEWLAQQSGDSSATTLLRDGA